MARLQILELPEGTSDDRPPFILVIDQVDDALAEDIARWPDDIAKRIGARQVLCFPGTIDIPANDTTTYLGSSRDSDEATPDTVRLHVEGDLEKYREQVREEIQYAMGKTTRPLAGEALGAERSDIARDMDRLAAWRDQLADALGTDRGTNWNDLRNTAAEYRTELIRSENAREHLRQERDTQAEAIERVRNLHRPVEHRGQTICWECSAYDFQQLTTDNPPVTYDQCHTLKALAADQPKPDA